MKHYLITATVRDGEHEHLAHHTVSAKTDASLNKKLDRMLRKEKSGFDHPTAAFGWGDGTTITTHFDTKEISADQANSLHTLGVAPHYPQ